jgi:hypothetical protein
MARLFAMVFVDFGTVIGCFAAASVAEPPAAAADALSDGAPVPIRVSQRQSMPYSLLTMTVDARQDHRGLPIATHFDLTPDSFAFRFVPLTSAGQAHQNPRLKPTPFQQERSPSVSPS